MYKGQDGKMEEPTMYNIKGGGNPKVAPEESESLTVGAVITPESVPGLTLTVDYFDITVEDGIGTVSAKTCS